MNPVTHPLRELHGAARSRAHTVGCGVTAAVPAAHGVHLVSFRKVLADTILDRAATAALFFDSVIVASNLLAFSSINLSRRGFEWPSTAPREGLRWTCPLDHLLKKILGSTDP